MNALGEKARELMMNGSIIKFWRKRIFEDKLCEMKLEGFDIYRFDCMDWNEERLHDSLAEGLNFPSYYGRNLDAFSDCLSDMSRETT